MKITTIGIDLAKTVFQIHGVDAHGKAVLRKQLKRKELRPFFAQLPPCLVGMEACGSAHYWARELQQFGHEMRLIAPQFVKPYVKSNKNDSADAAAICEAVGRPDMRFVAIKTAPAQALLAVHRARQGFIKQRTAQGNQIRGLLAEFGIVLPTGLHRLFEQLPGILEDGENGLPGLMRQTVARLHDHLRLLDQEVAALDRQITLWHRDDPTSQRLATVPGIGPLTASALAATFGHAQTFRTGRQFAAALGVVPRQHSTGGKPTLLGISKRGDVYLRTLLIHGARAVIANLARTATPDPWLQRLCTRRNANIAAVGLANKNARIVWALLTRGETYQPGHRPRQPLAA